MKNKRRAFVLVLVLVVILSAAAAGTAAAAVMASKNITVYTGVSIFVDGRELHPTDLSGDPVDAFIYEGTTYVPLRAVGEALGAEVSWDAADKTVYLNSEGGGEPEDRVAKYDAGSGQITYTCGPMNISSKYCEAKLDGFTMIDSRVAFTDPNHLDIVRLYDVFAVIKGTVYRSERDYFLCYANCYDDKGRLLRSDKIYEPVDMDKSNGDFIIRIIFSVPADTVRVEITSDRPY